MDAWLLFLHDSPDFDSDDDDRGDDDDDDDPRTEIVDLQVERWRQSRRAAVDDPVECVVDALMESLKICSDD